MSSGFEGVPADFPVIYPAPVPASIDGLCDRCFLPEPALVIGQDAYGHFHKLCIACAAWTLEEKLQADDEAELEIYGPGLEARPVLSCPFPRI